MEALEDVDGRTSPVGLPQVPDKELEEGPHRSIHGHNRGYLGRTATQRYASGEAVSDDASIPVPVHELSSTDVFESTGKPLGSDSISLESVHKDAPIVWHYLTYDTPSPQATGQNRSQGGAPEAPDLIPYTNPLEWSDFRKRSLIFLSCGATAITAYGAGMYAPGVDQMSAYFGESRVVTTIGITLFTAGFAIAPMVLAPFSELQGRRPMFLITGFLFFVFVLCCAFTHLFVGMLISRFLAGCASSTFSTMVGGVVSDIYVASERNTAMTLFTAGALFGTGIGPMVSGFIAYHINWRWTFWVHAIAVFANAIALLLFFRETRGTVLLSRKAKKLNEWYAAREKAGYYGFDIPRDGSQEKQSQRVRWKVKSDEERASILQMIKISLIRPVHMLFTEPVVFFFSLWISFAWSVLYSMFSIIPYMFETVYDFNLQQANAIFAALSIGAILATVLSMYQERIAARFGKHSTTPEGRLYYACIESVLLPIGLFWFGWTSSSSTPWIVPAIAVSCATIGIFSIYLAVFNYLADCYGPYASSAIAAQSFCRNMIGGTFPLFTEQMYQKLGFGGAGSLMGGIAIILTMVPWILVLYGPKIRARSKFASQIMNS